MFFLATQAACGSVNETASEACVATAVESAGISAVLPAALGGVERREILANARDASSAFGQRSARSPGMRFVLSTSALIRLRRSRTPRRQPDRRQCRCATTRSNTRRNTSLSRKRSCRARENTEWSGIPSSMPSLQNQR